MQCPACASEVAADALFCPQCGQRLDAAAAPVAPAKTPAEQVKTVKAAAQANNNNDVETPLWKGGFSWKAMLAYWVLAAAVTLALLVIAILFWAVPAIPIAVAAIILVLWLSLIAYFLYQRISLEYELTNQRLIHHYGILTRITNRIEVIDIDDIKFTQNILERMLGVGTIQILSTDVSDPKLVIRGIDDVKRVFALMDDARRDERRKRGMYIETV